MKYTTDQIELDNVIYKATEVDYEDHETIVATVIMNGITYKAAQVIGLEEPASEDVYQVTQNILQDGTCELILSKTITSQDDVYFVNATILDDGTQQLELIKK